MSSLQVALAVAKKELRTALRDRQALVYTLLLPLALYPVLFWVMLQGYLLVLGQRERTSVATAIAGAQDLAEEQRLRSGLSEPAPGAPPGPVDVRFAPEDPDLEAELRSGALDAALDLSPPAGGPSELRFDGSKSRSALARDRVEERLQALAADARIDALDGDAGALEAFRVERISLASQREESAYMLSFILPMMFCIMTVLGAFFPAIDTTAGEKERRTAETTLLLPVPRSGVLLGKLLAVSACAVAATALNVAGLLAAAEHLIAGLGGDASIEVSVPWGALPAAAPLLLLFIVTTSALMLAIGCGADTFKQGQSLLAPVQMVILLPAMIVSMPGIDLSPTLALVPVAQTALAFKAILQGDARVLDLVLVAVSQVLYAGLALALALRRGSSEALLLAGSGKKRKLGALLRRGRTP